MAFGRYSQSRDAWGRLKNSLHYNIYSNVLLNLPVYKYTSYFENEVLRKRSYLKKEWCIRVIENSIKVEQQEDNRYRFWGQILELDNKYLRVITLNDKQTIHNAFPDRRFRP
jgi:hypothetical protein